MHYIVYIKSHTTFHSSDHINTLAMNRLNLMFL